MKLTRILPVSVLVLVLTGCSIQSSDVTDSGRPPTGVAPGQTLYFLDHHGQLTPDFRDTGNLGTIADAVSLLLAGPGGSGLHTDIVSDTDTRAIITVEHTIRVRVPLSADELGEHGLNQIVCTAQSAYRQSGGSIGTKVHVELTLPDAASKQNLTCPLLR